MKLLSIIIPAYNVSEYIDNCISSLLQEESILEYLDIICVNDGSKDDTLEKMEKYPEKYPGTVRVIDKENGGHGSGINKGMELAEGVYVKVLDSDDWVRPEGLKNLVSAIAHMDRQPDMILNPFEFVYEKSDARRVVDYPALPKKKVLPLEKLNENGYMGTIHSITFRTSIFQKNRLPKLDEKVSYDDVEYILYPIRYVRTVMYLPDIIYEYRYGTETQSVSSDNYVKRRDQHRRIIRSLIAYYRREENHLSGPQRRYYLRRLNLMVDDHIGILMRIEDTEKSRKELYRFVRECEESKFDLSAVGNRKLNVLRKTHFFGYPLIKWYYNHRKVGRNG